MNRATVAAAATTLVLGVAACTGSNSPGVASARPTSSGGSASAGALAYSRCMRAHGVPNFPDPDDAGNLPKGDAQAFGVSDSRLQSARTACQQLLPDAGGPLNADSFRQCVLAGDCPQALVEQALTEMRDFARCMRSHGVPNWPDPAVGPHGAPFFPLSSNGISRQQEDSQRIRTTTQRCGHEMPDVGGVPVG